MQSQGDNAQFVSVRNLRDQIRDILENAHYLGQPYVITHHGAPIAQILSAASTHIEAAKEIAVTELRVKTREILEAIYLQRECYLVSTHGRAMAIICPIPEAVPVEPIPGQTESVE